MRSTARLLPPIFPTRFGDVAWIEADGRGEAELGRRDGSCSSRIELEDGDRLRGTNDVNDDNRGILGEVEGLGRLTIDWEDFESFRLQAAGWEMLNGSAGSANFDIPLENVARLEPLDGDG